MQRHDRFIAPLLRMIPHWVTPNHLAILRLISAVPIAIAILMQWYGVAAFIFIGASLLDLIDGSLARMRNQMTLAGEMLDPFADKVIFGVTFALLGYTLLPANLYLSVLMVEFVTLFGAAVTASVWYYLHHEEPRVSANRLGKYKTVSYALATLLLFVSPWSILIYLIAIVLYYLGLLCAVLSMVTYSLNLARKP